MAHCGNQLSQVCRFSFLGGEIDNYQFHCLFGSPVCANEVEYSGAIISLLKDAEFEDFCVF